MKFTTIQLPDNFEKGDCDNCPFIYIEEEFYPEFKSCFFHYKYKDKGECKLEVRETVKVRDIVDEVFGQLRDATEQEQKSVSDFVESLSKPRGINFYDVLDENGEIKYNEFIEMCKQTKMESEEV